MDKIKCEIINPSDEVFIEHESKEALALAVYFLGYGQYGLEEIDGDFGVPVMLFGGADIWYEETFGRSAQDTYDTTNDAVIAEALQSVHMEHERTSMNDIVARAYDLAEKFAKSPEALAYISYAVTED